MRATGCTCVARLAIASFCLVTVAGACGRRPPPSSRSDVATAGDTLASLQAGDFVHPTFSPSGERLALSQVVVEEKFENTQLLVLDIESGRLDTLLAADAARRYGYYAAYVSEFEWLGEDRLAATILDGDVNGTVVTLDLASGTVIDELYLEDEADFELPPERQRLAERLFQLYPAIRPKREATARVFESALRSYAVIFGDTAAILQKSYAGFDNHVWYYSARDSLAFPIVELPGRAIAAFGGGVAVGNAAAFAVRRDSVAELYIYEGGRSARLATRAPLGRQTPVVRVRQRDAEAAWFIVQAYQPYEEGHNPAFRFDGSSLEELGDYERLHDFDVNLAAGRIAFAYWEDGRRKVVVKKLVPA